MTYSRTHKSLADELGVPLSAVAMVREVLRNSSAVSVRAMAESDGDVAQAARWLAAFRGCHKVAEAITPQVVAAVVAAS